MHESDTSSEVMDSRLNKYYAIVLILKLTDWLILILIILTVILHQS